MVLERLINMKSDELLFLINQIILSLNRINNSSYHCQKIDFLPNANVSVLFCEDSSLSVISLPLFLFSGTTVFGSVIQNSSFIFKMGIYQDSGLSSIFLLQNFAIDTNLYPLMNR